MLSANTSIKAEYSYIDFDKETYNYISGLFVALPTQSSGPSDLHAIKVGLNYHF
jgi:opacity protein-like surface antigen